MGRSKKKPLLYLFITGFHSGSSLPTFPTPTEHTPHLPCLDAYDLVKTKNFILTPSKKVISRNIFPTETYSNRRGVVEASCRCYGRSERGDKESHIFTSKNLDLNVVTKLMSVLIVSKLSD